LKVLVGKETGRPVIASLNDVMRYSATLDTCASWHGLPLSLYQNRSISRLRPHYSLSLPYCSNSLSAEED
jgi:hypothetical protein